ncbi:MULTISPECIES: trifunctional serine/threonine-protein kinase/ATP-binding protein/sensor histidine kinase [Kamptonema]|uniref:trifunctional serine/threonine-protein kinase/ATP-binding protein/sensor histidine kinase n=1 Tax=Kamptonema TaxID=1501433 RepID=UPI0001DACF86|nr:MULTISPECIES: ATP-binding sensor histidine kinase [Kamptonema]CBN58215.1 ATP-binding region, ATPase-like [Kamptonema sp. PCC 6506]
MHPRSNFSNYQITEELYAGTRTLVYRGIRISNQQPVVIKLLRNEYPSFNEIIQFRNQYTIAKNLTFPSVIQPLSLEPYRNSYALVMEDFGGVSLSTYYLKTATNDRKTNKYLPLAEFLNIVIRLTDILHYLYQNCVIHKDIKPANILINPDTKQIKLIDFSISSLLPRETQEIQNPNVLEGTLAYISPEQTGRMNRGIDYRSDFYSLGVTLYELLTGSLPFVSADAMELVHCHLAKHPIPIHQINPEIPLSLSEIVSKLMAKNAENRYQTALGIKHDLEICLEQLQTTGKIESFELGKRDISDRFTIPDQLYGREAEVENLLEAFDRVSQGATEMMLVAGFSGIGKTAVVNEVHKPIVRQRGYFIKGKYDQFNRNIPLSAFVQAFRDLMGQLLSESDTQLLQWKEKILSALGENGQVLIDVIPELEQIIGKQPAVPELGGSAALNRFNLLFGKFIALFATQQHPLVMFLDDLQWADSASLSLMQVLMSQSQICYLLIGAYRDNEVFPAHPLMLTLEEMKKDSATISTLTLAPLSQSHINLLVADTVSCSTITAQPLSELVYQKTQGNPFFATQFLKALHQDSYIAYDFNVGYWQCDIAAVKLLSLTDNVVEFMAMQLQKLPDTTQNVLKLAACIGAQFDLETLAIVSEFSSIEAATALWKALQEGLILPTSQIYKFFLGTQHSQAEDTVNPSYRFLHDRVQQAAYSLIPDDQKQATHLSIGQLLHDNISETELEKHIFEIVNHWNQAIALVLDSANKDRLAQLNSIAGRKAKASSAYEPALKYFNTGLTLLSEQTWQTQPNLTLALHEGAAEAACLCGNFAEMEQRVSEILAQKLHPLDRVTAYEIKIDTYTTQNRPQEAIAIAHTALKQFHIYLPKQPTEAGIATELEEVADLLHNKTTHDLLNLPEMTEAESLAAMQLLSSLMPVAHVSAPLLLPFVIIASVKLSLQKGNAALSAYAYSCYATLLSSIVEDVDAAYAFAQLGLQIVENLNARRIRSKVSFVVAAFIVHCKSHLRESLPLFREAFQVGLEVGDIVHASSSVAWFYQSAYLSGQHLGTLVSEADPYITALLKLNIVTASNYSYLALAAIQRLQGTQSQTELDAQTAQLYTTLTAANDLLGLHFYWVYHLTAFYLFNEIAQAVQAADEARQTLAAGLGFFTIPTFYFYDSLTALAAYPEATDKAALLDRIWANQTKLYHRAQHAPMNFQHKYDLVAAERCRVLGNKTEAIDLYDRAISLARANDYIQEAALANELAAKFYLDWGKERIAGEYAIEAYYGYAHWGAKAKVVDLETRYPQLLRPILEQTRSTLSTHETLFTLGGVTSSSSAISSSNVSLALDLATILKASHTISAEIELENLLSSLMTIVIENAGADKCVLMLLRDSHLLIKGSITTGSKPVVLQRIPIEDSQDIPHRLIYKVLHDKQTAVLVNASADRTLANDPYIIRQQPKSILCSPILHQGKLMGILYLENNLATGAFTSDRVELLNLLCAQAAISLENAQLYERSQEYAQQLERSLDDLQQAQLQIIQGEKMSALGNLVAGVAHEINNPVGFLGGNIQPALDYINDLFELIDLYQQKQPEADIEEKIYTIDLDYIREDLPKLVGSMREGVKRIADISTSLRTFSRADTDRSIPCNIHDGIDSTIMILKHRLKANENRPEIQVVKEYGNLPKIECYAGQLNQVFMNLLSNAIDALEDSNQGYKYAEIPNKITVKTELSEDKKQAIIRIADNGIGMSEEVQAKIFEHLFTTKGVGKGTGLGLAIARQIIEEKHQGSISVHSENGVGTEFIISIPIQ